MTKPHIFLIGTFLLTPVLATANQCSKANLTRCLDSVCAINITSNPAARCQYCGTSNAGTPPKGGMKSISAGKSSKNTISDKELKNAPSDPAERYVWGSEKCLELLPDCTDEDITDTYDELIEKSCTAAGINAQMSSLQKKATKTKNQSSCTAEISACIVNDKHCGTGYAKCSDESIFEQKLSECSIESIGCDTFLADIRTNLNTARQDALENTSVAIEKIAQAHKSNREKNLENLQSGCSNKSLFNQCVNKVCNTHMKNKCAAGFNSEKSRAELLCKFYDTACATIK
ncbi:MAG: hypothetical protein ACLRFI_03950 [Alphaproteobacteria bacterium]